MKKVILSLTGTALIALALAGCAPGYNTPGATAVGAVTGGVLGGVISNSPVGVVAGGLIGGTLGYMVGRNMDRQDMYYMQNAVGAPEPTYWENPRTHVAYDVRPGAYYRSNGMQCRRYMTKIRINGQWRSAWGRACRAPDGSWAIAR